MKIRKATQRDIKDLEKVEMSSGYHKKKFNFVPYLEELFNNKNYVFCAEDKDILIGYITLNKKGEIAYLAVLKKFHGKGIGNKLLKRVISFARKNKIKRLFLDVRNDNLSAINLYLRNKFIVVGLHKKKIGKNEIIKLRMERRLA